MLFQINKISPEHINRVVDAMRFDEVSKIMLIKVLTQ